MIAVDNRSFRTLTGTRVRNGDFQPLIGDRTSWEAARATLVSEAESPATSWAANGQGTHSEYPPIDCDEQSPRQGNCNRDIPEAARGITEKAKTQEHNHGEWGDGYRVPILPQELHLPIQPRKRLRFVKASPLCALLFHSHGKADVESSRTLEHDAVR
jgi:hypothetical protein